MYSLLQRARLSFLLDQHLSASVCHLKDESLKLYKRYLAYLDAVKDELEDEGDDTTKLDETVTVLLAEQSYCQLHFFKHEKAQESINQAKKLSDLNIEFAGKMGKRTRFQRRDIAQLTVDFDTRAVNLNIQDVNSQINTDTNEYKDDLVVDNLVEKSGVFRPDIETSKYLQAESIYWPNGLPKLADGQVQRQLSESDVVLLQAFTFYQFKNLPNDEHREVILRPLSTTLTFEENKKNWLLDTNALLLKSRNDYERNKTKESSMIYLQGILDSFRTQKSNYYSKGTHVFAVNYSLRWNLQKELANFFKSMGCFVSAFELLHEVCLYEDAITCLFSAGRQT